VPEKLRIDYDGALHHVAVNGNNRQAMFFDDRDRFNVLGLLRDSAELYGWDVWSYCLMDTHWHLLVRTPRTLSRGMQRLNSLYSKRFNARHGRSGHSIRHRFMSVPVETDNHLRELTRYLPLNPVRAGLAPTAELWPWSSYHHELAPGDAPDWLRSAWSLDIHGSVKRLRAYVEAGGRDPVDP
jgi:putative transposase